MKCVYCGTEFEPSRSNQKYCSRDCYCDATRLMQNAKRSQRLRQNPELRRQLNRKYKLARKERQKADQKRPIKESVCYMCGKKFIPHFKNEHFCSDDCRFDSPLYRDIANFDLWRAL